MDLSPYHPVVSEIVALLEKDSLWHEVFVHEPVRTSEEAARVRSDYTIEQGAKAIILRAKKSQKDKFFVMLVLPGDKKFDALKVKEILGVKDIRFATVDEVINITEGIQPGGVPPFGNLFKLPVYADPSLLENERIIFNAGDRRISVAMNSKDFITLVQPLLSKIS